MTPKREVYFNKCSNREKTLRLITKSIKREIKKHKEFLNGGYGDESDYHYFQIGKYKVALKALNHELARIKGMDRVCVPKVTDAHILGGLRLWCTCGKQLSRSNKYCPDCGKRILWEKVK